MEENLIKNYFTADHDRLGSIFGQFWTLKPNHLVESMQYLNAFRTGLQRHIVWEEEILFPLFESKIGDMVSGPTSVMRSEHRTIAAALDTIQTIVREENPNTDSEERALLQVLEEHNQKEENILYPFLDRMISIREVGSIFLKMEEISEEQIDKFFET